jgi:hypothetical protein
VAAAPQREFEHLREHSIGLPGVPFQSVTHMAPGAAIAFSILVSVQFAGPTLPLSVLFARAARLPVHHPRVRDATEEVFRNELGIDIPAITTSA